MGSYVEKVVEQRMSDAAIYSSWSGVSDREASEMYAMYAKAVQAEVRSLKVMSKTLFVDYIEGEIDDIRDEEKENIQLSKEENMCSSFLSWLKFEKKSRNVIE